MGFIVRWYHFTTNPTCPVCTRTFTTPQGLSHHFQHRRKDGDASHIAYETAREDARWSDLTEGADYVRYLRERLRALGVFA